MGKKNPEKISEENDIVDETTENEEAGSDTVIVEDAKEALSKEEQLQNQVAELTDRLRRNMAEFDNFRKRTVKEKSEMYDIGLISAAEKLLPVADNFERALNAAPDKEDNMYKGILMIYKQLSEALKSLGVEAIECVGEKFNPNIHDAVAHEKNSDYKENTIIEELQKGYKYKEKVIRPSMVKVAN